MPKKIVNYAALLLMTFAFGVAAADSPNKDVKPEIAKAILEKLAAARPDLDFGSVSRSPIDGLYQVRVNGTQLLYVSEDGAHVVAGDMYQALPGRLVPVEDLELAQIRRELLADIKTSETITFPSKRENGKTAAVLYVFTDVDCGFCRKLHNEAVPTLNEKGVEVRYLAFPRAGIGSPSYRKIASAWCADDKRDALTKLKNGSNIADKVCKDNPVAEQYELGKKMGVTGTPALVLSDGTMVPGFRPAEELLQILGVN